MRVPAPLRRVVVLIVGGATLLAGLVMLVTPGPGLVVILVGLATLASEFPWARRLLARVREEANTRGQQAGGWWRRLRGRDSDRP